MNWYEIAKDMYPNRNLDPESMDFDEGAYEQARSSFLKALTPSDWGFVVLRENYKEGSGRVIVQPVANLDTGDYEEWDDEGFDLDFVEDVIRAVGLEPSGTAEDQVFVDNVSLKDMKKVRLEMSSRGYTERPELDDSGGQQLVID